MSAVEMQNQNPDPKPDPTADGRSETPVWEQIRERLALGWRRAAAGLSNARRRLVRKRLPDYVTLTLDGPLRDLAPEVPWYVRLVAPGAAPVSLQTLTTSLRQVAEDPDVRGLLLIVKGATMSRVTAQNSAAMLARFRDWDKSANPHG
ncbi:MAG: hypothetical protein ACRC1H_09400, partial [Caldilineaceae bacterium]